MAGKRRLVLDEEAFSNYGEAAEYWLGVLATDGCIGFAKNRAVPVISYGGADIEHVYKFRDFLKSGHAVGLIDRVNHLGPCKGAKLSFSSSKIGELLICNGITPKKSLTLEVSERLARSPHFWRGAIDGDGSITVCGKLSQPRVKFSSSSLRFINQFAEFCKSLRLRPKIDCTSGNFLTVSPHYVVMLTSMQALDLLHVLYAGATVWLDRKKVKVDEIFAQPIRHKYVRRTAGGSVVVISA